MAAVCQQILPGIWQATGTLRNNMKVMRSIFYFAGTDDADRTFVDQSSYLDNVARCLNMIDVATASLAKTCVTALLHEAQSARTAFDTFCEDHPQLSFEKLMEAHTTRTFDVGYFRGAYL